MQLSFGMEREEKNQRGISSKAIEPEFFLQWGTKKKLRCVRVRDPRVISKRSDVGFGFGVNGGLFRRRATSKIDRYVVSSPASEKQNSPNLQYNHRLTRNSEAAAGIRSSTTENRKPSSPEKEDRYYATRGSGSNDENGKLTMDGEEKRFVWPKLYITLSSKEKEEDFMAMKGCKPPQRPKKRAKIIQRSLLLVSPGAWLSDMCLERYEVREKKSTKKRPRGLKAMDSMESDSE